MTTTVKIPYQPKRKARKITLSISDDLMSDVYYSTYRDGKTLYEHPRSSDVAILLNYLRKATLKADLGDDPYPMMISRKLMAKKLGSSKRWQEVRKALINSGMMASNEEYIFKQTCKCYVMTPKALAFKWEDTEMDYTPQLEEKICEIIGVKEIDTPDLTIHCDEMDVWTTGIDRAWQPSEMTKQQNAINEIKEQRITVKIGSTGRIYYAVNKIAKEFRNFLRIDGEETVECDVKNCQPFILYHLTEGEERTKYAQLLSDGFYERFAVENGMTRDKAKKAFLNSFGANWYKPKFLKWCEIEFPKLHDKIIKIKKNNHRNLARFLQTVEAKIMLNVVEPKLVAHGIKCYSIHDSFIVKESDAPKVARIMRKAFRDALTIDPIISIGKGCKRAEEARQERIEATKQKGKATIDDYADAFAY